MCILALQYQAANDAPILLVHNRDEFYNRAAHPPRIQPGRPKILCGVDRKAGGTWLGVNQYGLVVAVVNRPKLHVPPQPRSRGLLCRDLLGYYCAQEAVESALRELKTGNYAGVNLLCADKNYAAVIHAGEQLEVVPISPGLHLLTSSNVDDWSDPRQEFARRMLTLQRLDSAVAFLAVASRTFSRKANSEGRRGLVIVGKDYGTVSSTLMAIPDRTQNAVYQYAPGPPSDVPYEDYSALLRQVLSADKSSEKAVERSGEKLAER